MKYSTIAIYMAIILFATVLGCSKDGASSSCRPDYFIRSFSFSNYAPVTGEALELSILVANGTAESICYRPSMPDTQTSKLLMECYFKPPNNSYELAGSGMIDVRYISIGDTAIIKQGLSFHQPGTYTFGLTCDATNLIAESNESNNLYGYRKKRSISLGTITVSKPTGSIEEQSPNILQKNQNQFVTFQNHNTQ